MPFLKNFRGAKLYAMPSDDKYRDNYDRIFGRKDDAGAHCPEGEHHYPSRNTGFLQGELSLVCSKCGYSLLPKEGR